MTFVYWIHTPEHWDITKEGYVGVSKLPARRLHQHKSSQQNPHLTNAFKKYKDIVHTILLKGTESYCYEIEEKLRPDVNIGWNINKGGEKPPSMAGQKFSEDHKTKLRKPKPPGFKESRTGTANPNWGKGAAKGRRWYYNPITKYSTYFLPDTQPEGWVVGRYSRKRFECQ